MLRSTLAMFRMNAAKAFEEALPPLDLHTAVVGVSPDRVGEANRKLLEIATERSAEIKREMVRLEDELAGTELTIRATKAALDTLSAPRATPYDPNAPLIPERFK